MVRGLAAARGASSAGGSDGGPSILGRGARVRGRIGGEGDLRVEGQVEGDVVVSGELSIEEGASVTGDVGAAALVVGGALKGDVEARGAVALRATAEVEGNLSGAEVSIEEGASFHGRIDAEFDLPAELSGTVGHDGGARPHSPGAGRGGRR
jgi:cytoskeletal protein CcmA (bactofilin family)